jgi:hypothetical protein
LPGEGWSESTPKAANLLTVLPALHKMFVTSPQRVADLLRAYAPVAPAAARPCPMTILTQIDAMIGTCLSYCEGFRQAVQWDKFLITWLVADYGELRAAVYELAIALDQLEREMERIWPALPDELAEEGADYEARLVWKWDCSRPVVGAMDAEIVGAVERATAGMKAQLELCRDGLGADEGDSLREALAQYRPIMSLRAHWEPVFGTYKRLTAALKKTPRVPQRAAGQRRSVDVAAFLAWLEKVKTVAASGGIDPRNSATWTEDFWDAVALEFAEYERTKRTLEAEKRRGRG